jgi:hypothetical protein
VNFSPDHVEIEFEKPQYQNCESNALYPELMIDFALSLTFCSLFPIILLWNLLTVYLKTHQFLTRKFQSASILETRRFHVPYVKPMFATVYFIATLMNFYHFYEYFENFTSATMNEILGETYLEGSRFWILLLAEHFVIGLFIVVNLFNKGRLNFVKKRR